MIDITMWLERLSVKEGKMNKILEFLNEFNIDFEIWFDSAIQAFELAYLKMFFTYWT